MGLPAYILPNSGLNAHERCTLYLFCGTRSDTVKGICFEGIGIPVFEDGKVVQ